MITLKKSELIYRITEIASQMDDEGEFDIEIKPHKDKRSSEANRYFWALVDSLSVKLRIPKTEIYKGYIREIGGVSEIGCFQNKAVDRVRENWTKQGIGWQTDILDSKVDGCTNVILYFGSSTYTTEQMSSLIDLAVSDCKEQGILTEPQEVVDDLLRKWGKK